VKPFSTGEFSHHRADLQICHSCMLHSMLRGLAERGGKRPEIKGICAQQDATQKRSGNEHFTP
jgi:hypothetical protein